ncbi:D-aspartate oxidase isoform X2 [Sagmatias obliquidens]|uniref:D-aspartate oxidase isoform X2 n=1 Tax=Sagmatias obliquidens TaxID=3371155 RepID=UPI000F440FA3|nr:D-aspartate oxidase isoform X2 [Lagenorhynchus obliquidens]XP_026935598.1 D-aspartate oxidase isoform X2 [Lagenorhynchus obliquidens]
MGTVRIATVGAGVMGLSTAVCISKLVPRCSITVISEQFTPETTSDVAAGMLIPPVYPDTPIHKQKQWFKETFDHLFAIANSAEAEDAGVLLVSGWQIFRSIPTEEVPFWADVVLGFRKMTENELKKFPQHVFGQAFTTLKCEGPVYLPWLEKRLKGSGGLILTRRIEDLWELHPSFDIVVNCSGLGSRQLAGDPKIFPVRGQVLKVQAPWVKHFIRDGSGLTYIYPGISNVTLGGTRQKGDWNLSPDAEISKGILSRCCALEPSLHGACDIREKVGLRPTRPGVRLEKELLAQGSRRLPVVHHYGHGSGGIAMHWGTALEAARLVSECAQALRTPAPKSKL